MNCPQPALVVTTLASAEAARAMAQDLVGRRLAACAQITAIESVYRWQGTIAHEPEWRLLLKTRADRAHALMDAVRAAHPYELPSILVLAVQAADPAFAAWVDEETRPG